MNVHDVFTAWANFYIITGSSSAALTGLVFIVVTLVAERRRDTPTTREGTSIFSSPTVIHFCAAFFVSCVFAAPWPAPGLAGTTIGLAGLAGTLLLVRVMYRAARITIYQPDLSDWIWFVLLPMAAYIVLTISGFMLVHLPAQASFAVAGATLVLVFIGIHNAWDVVTYLAIDRPDE